jgi:glyoxylase-like metal-dependent hydrolase (beta-lactamase superfamily II)
MTKRWFSLVLAAAVGLGGGYVTWSRVFLREAAPSVGPVGPVHLDPAVAGLRLHVFETGRMVIPGWSVAVGGRGERAMDQPAYLVEHPTRGLLMFEAGHHSDISRDAEEHLGLNYTLGLLPMEQQAGQDARTQIANAGFDPDAVGHVVVSHFHPEHVGAVEEFPKAAITADAREIAWAQQNPDYNYVPSEYDDVSRWRAIDFDPHQPFGPFPSSFDLFGDGSVLVVSTPGHTPGHVSLLVNLPAGPVLLTGDMAWTELNLDTQTIGLPFVSSDGEAARVSLGQAVRFRREHPEVLVVPGHDLAPLRRAKRADVVLHPWPEANQVSLGTAERG